MVKGIKNWADLWFPGNRGVSCRPWSEFSEKKGGKRKRGQGRVGKQGVSPVAAKAKVCASGKPAQAEGKRAARAAADWPSRPQQARWLPNKGRHASHVVPNCRWRVRGDTRPKATK